jgi:hypothetical protein
VINTQEQILINMGLGDSLGAEGEGDSQKLRNPEIKEKLPKRPHGLCSSFGSRRLLLFKTRRPRASVPI